GRRLRPRPLPMRLDDVEAAEAACALVALLHLLADVRRAAADLPFVHAGVGAEGAAGFDDGTMAPAADRLAGCIAYRFTPVVGRNRTGAKGTHAWIYRRDS